MIIHKDEEELLRELVRTNLDVEAAFTVCAHKAADERLSAMLLARALVCGHAARQLGKVLNAHGAELQEHEDGARVTAPDWMALQAALIEGNDDAVREECARTEDMTLIRFRDVLEHDLSNDTQRAVESHFAALLQYSGRLRKLRLPRNSRQARSTQAGSCVR